LRATFDRIKDDPLQFAEHGLLAVKVDDRPLFFSVRRALLPKPFPYVVFYYVRENVVVSSRSRMAGADRGIGSSAPDLISEVRQAISDIEAGDYLELTAEQLNEWAEKGQLRVLDEWLAESHD
jgi:hypothetical protein